ncbi:hypothetical protein OG244_15055 [Streptomyces brevispora]|uniref:hypothetical protein n=1 Tax=Streptomyces brevispora TaxID=887462 RepID=UPI002E311ADF|nr:hypothetical protein [Streptomyces brevispora]
MKLTSLRPIPLRLIPVRLIPVRLVLAVGAAEIRLRTRFPQVMDAFTRQRGRVNDPPVTWDHIDSDGESRARFFAALDVAIEQRITERVAETAQLDMFVASVEAAAETLKAVNGPPPRERAA